MFGFRMAGLSSDRFGFYGKFRKGANGCVQACLIKARIARLGDIGNGSAS